MANKWALFSSLIITLFQIGLTQYWPDYYHEFSDPTDSFDCYSNYFNIAKYTLASSDSYRDTKNIQLIFPQVRIEYAPNFIQDKCARSSKVFLPHSCFKLHAPQTWEHEEGYLSVKTLEKEYTKKFYAVINGYSKHEFDAFFDNNMAFWVNTMDIYLQQINDNSDTLTSYLGLKWYHSSLDKTFYSLIIQSPDSQRVLELISFNEPDLSLYPNLRDNFKWTETSTIRASFLQYPQDEYPWTMFNWDIVPIRIGYSTSNLDDQIRFYTDIMEAKLLEWKSGTTDVMDNQLVSFAFLQPAGSLIEIQYIQRPAAYTYGVFTIETYTRLLMETHNDRIVGEFCGLDRWFDNHYGYDTSSFFTNKDFENYKYMDRVLLNVRNNGYKYRLYWTSYIMYTPYEDGDDRYDAMYKLFVFDRNGQTIQIIGYLFDTSVPKQPPIYSHQWCDVPCPYDQAMGKFDQEKVYVEDDMDIVSKIIAGDILPQDVVFDDKEQSKHMNYKLLIVLCVIGVVLFGFILFLIYWCYTYVKRTREERDGGETQLLLP